MFYIILSLYYELNNDNFGKAIQDYRIYYFYDYHLYGGLLRQSLYYTHIEYIQRYFHFF
jgi:hypothetical protein